jgi:lipoprotein LprG
MRRSGRTVLTGAVLAAALSGCGSSQQPNAATMLSHAKALLDAATSAHFTLTSTGASGTGVVLRGGSGDMQRPNSFSGRLDVDISGFTANVDAVSVNGKFFVRDPLSGTFETADPSSYGFADPTGLLDPSTGLSSLLTRCQRPSVLSDDRQHGELLHEVSCSLPGQAVAALLPDAAPDRPVSATIGIVAGSGQLRRVSLTGPFYSSTSASTFQLVVDRYGENVRITPPAAAS